MAEKRIIAYFIDTISSDKAGTEKQLLEIIRRLDKNTFEPILICLYTSPWMEINELPCKYYVLGYTGFIKPSFPLVTWRLAKMIREHRIDIIQTFFEDSIFVGWLGALLSRTHPVLLSSRRDMGLGKDDLWYHALFKTLLSVVNLKFDGIIANCNRVKEYVSWKEKTSMDKIKVIYNGIDIPYDMVEPPSVFSDYKADIWIGITANFKPVKRVDMFLNGLAYLKNMSTVNFHAIILGEGNEEGSLRDLARELGLSSIVHFIGSVDNVCAYLKHLNVGVLCSDKEGFSNAVMEYMACGLPVVATAIGGNTELVDEENGIVVPVGDCEALGVSLLKLVNLPDLRRKMGQVSRKKIENLYTWDKIISQWEQFYLSIL
jgi:L-malate glycosyltransferase